MSPTATIPIHYKLLSNKVGDAIVDSSLHPLLSTFQWYLADNRVVRPPRTVFRVSGQQRFILLNRLVVALTPLSPAERLTLVRERVLLWEVVRRVPPVSPQDGNHWNCQRENLVVLTEAPTKANRKASLTPPEGALPSLLPLQEAFDNLSQSIQHNKDMVGDMLQKGMDEQQLAVQSTPDLSALDLLSPSHPSPLTQENK